MAALSAIQVGASSQMCDLRSSVAVARQPYERRGSAVAGRLSGA